LFVNNPKLLTLLGEQKFVEAVEIRQRALDDGRHALAQLRQQSTLAEEIADGDLLGSWQSLTVQEKRRLMHGLLDCVVVHRADSRGRHAKPIGDRTQIVLRGNALLSSDPDGRVGNLRREDEP
jgi:hypothetical protein